MKDLGRAFVITVDQFTKAFLPRLPDDMDETAIERITASMKRARGERNTWSPLDVRPSESGRSENATFEPLKPLFDDMVQRARKVTHADQNFDFVMEPNTAPTSATRPSRFRPDAVAIETSTRSRPIEFDNIAWCGEFKKLSGPQDTQDVSATPTGLFLFVTYRLTELL